MIEVSISHCDNNNSVTLSLKGHAGYAEHGKDIVCSAASVLAYTFAQIVMAMEHHGDLAKSASINLSAGDISIACEVKSKEVYAEALHTLFVIQTGYTILEYNYAKNIRIIKTIGEDI